MSNSQRFYESVTAGARRSAPAALRNREPISQVLKEWLPKRGLVLEIASGTGEHAIYFAQRFPSLDWQPSDIHSDSLASIEAWREQSALVNVCPVLSLDASQGDWKICHADAVLNINMVHISPWKSALGLLDGARHLLAEGGPLILYGPWITDAASTASSNVAFDRDLRDRNPEWGLRKVEDFAAEAEVRGFRLVEVRPMPANNVMLLLHRC